MATSLNEKEGTFTNFEGRTQRFNKVLEPLAGARPEIEILRGLAGLMKIALPDGSAEDVFNELARREKPFQGLSYAALETGGTDIRILAEPVIPPLEQEGDIL